MTILQKVEKEFEKNGVKFELIKEFEFSYWGCISILNYTKMEVEFSKETELWQIKHIVEDYVESYTNYLQEFGA